MNDLDKIRIGMGLMHMANVEGSEAVLAFLRECASEVATNGDRELIEPLIELTGIGPSLAFEIMAKTGWFVTTDNGKEPEDV